MVNYNIKPLKINGVFFTNIFTFQLSGFDICRFFGLHFFDYYIEMQMGYTIINQLQRRKIFRHGQIQIVKSVHISIFL